MVSYILWYQISLTTTSVEMGLVSWGFMALCWVGMNGVLYFIATVGKTVLFSVSAEGELPFLPCLMLEVTPQSYIRSCVVLIIARFHSLFVFVVHFAAYLTGISSIMLI